MKRAFNIRIKIDTILMLVMLPLLGLVASNKPVLDYMEFPPLTRYVRHADFSWIMFIGLAVIILLMICPFVFRVMTAKVGGIPPMRRRQSSFPWWGRLGLALTLLAWALSWTRFSWFTPFQVFTFTPLWVGYILTVNGLIYKRTGHCLLNDKPVFLLSLFVFSAFFWWYFEYLNRFVQNWAYVGIEDLSPIQYFFFATLPFSTVLPAVYSTRELLTAMPRVSAGLDDFIKIPISNSKILPWASMVVFSVGLSAIGIWPDYLFPLLWLSPLMIIVSLQAIRGEKTFFSGVATGNWKSLYLWALSALICGFFWEIWNYHSLAKWVYAIPFVHRFKLFEMPILGYAGYLPFGLECAVVVEFFLKQWRMIDTDTMSIT